MLKIVKVYGASMAPTLAPGDYMIITKARALRPGFVVLVNHPEYGTIVKRITSIENGQQITLKGDGPESTSTEDMGLVSLSDVTGRARLAITPKGIKRL